MIQFEIPMIGLVGLVAVMGMIIIVLGAALARSRSPSSSSTIVTEGTALVKSVSKMEAGGGLQAAPGPPTPVQPQTQSGPGGILQYFGMGQKSSFVDPDVPKDENYLGKISFRLSYCKDRHTFSVHILEALDLPAMDIGGSSDPSKRRQIDENPSEKPLSQVCTDPQFHWFELWFFQNEVPLEENWSFWWISGHTPKTIATMTLCVQVMDYDRFSRDDPIGEILLPMKNVKLTNDPVYWKQLQKPTVHKEYIGEVLISLCYLSQTNKLNVVVSKAKDLPAKDVIGTSDPYVKLWWVQNGIKMEKHKTTVKNQILNPLYNEAFTFTLPPKETLDKDAQLVITVMDHDLLSSNDEIGHVVIGSKSGTESGLKHWKDVLNNPDQPISHWHQLSPKW